MKTKEITEGFFRAIANIAQDAVDGKFASTAQQATNLKASREKGIKLVQDQFFKRWASMAKSIYVGASASGHDVELADLTSALTKIALKIIRIDPTDTTGRGQDVSALISNLAEETLIVGNKDPGDIAKSQSVRKASRDLMLFSVHAKAELAKQTPAQARKIQSSPSPSPTNTATTYRGYWHKTLGNPYVLFNKVWKEIKPVTGKTGVYLVGNEASRFEYDHYIEQGPTQELSGELSPDGRTFKVH